MSVGKQSAFRGQSINIGSPGLRVPVKAANPVIQIVDCNEQDVWPRVGCMDRERANMRRE